ncbi:transporter [Sphingomonas sp. BIUV-7]|uniref:Transporter n=1 Tax=Sphingomonas natans TaxID=3063330 RepID=A0ABT8Y6G1_9SPHN|nr:transporter [Sphingomonas sp. BIUV-7]MDO6413265.1 transporter [Sphingomonas sp. BIUV-7]
MMRIWAIAATMLAAAPATAADLRDLCTDRPGLGTPACTVDAGHLQIETGLADWTHDSNADSRTDTFLLGNMLGRFGVGPTTEVRLGWSAYGRERERDKMSGDIETAHRTGDITLGLKQNLANPDGEGFSLAVLPSVSIPVGRQPIGAGTWSASLLVPVSFEINPDLHLQFTPEADAAANESGNGRHLAVGSTAGVDFGLTKQLDLELEVQAIRDRDPSGHATTTLASASFAYKIGDNLQFDVGGVAGLNRSSPDIEAYWGVVRRF